MIQVLHTVQQPQRLAQPLYYLSIDVESNEFTTLIYVCLVHYDIMHLFIHLLIHSFIHSSIHPFIHSFIHSFIHFFMHSFIHAFICLCTCIYTNIQQPRTRQKNTILYTKMVISKYVCFFWRLLCYMYICISTKQMYIKICIYTYVYTCGYMYIYMCVCMYIYILICIYVCVCASYIIILMLV